MSVGQIATSVMILYVAFYTKNVAANYLVGVGRADCTGPAAGIIFMGYGRLTQAGCGIHLRQFSRAYIFDDGNKRVAYVTVDTGMMNNPLKEAVIDELTKTYNDLYTVENVIISGTHTHSAPGGYLKDFFLDISITGFVKETFNALVDGIVRSIVRAHDNMVESKLYISQGELLNTNINRSPAAYLYNPEEERNRYKYDTDTELVQLKIIRTLDGILIGAINWYPVHPTSMNYSNCLVSSDNVGYASILLEKSQNVNNLPGQGTFVGAFASTNLGDVSPNTKGPICVKSGKKCHFVHSTCEDETEQCIAFGPGNDMFESTSIIATNLYEKALDLLSSDSSVEVTGDIKHIHQFVYMPNQTVTLEYGNGTTYTVKACRPAMGHSFAAGTTDGPGPLFKQGISNNPLIREVEKHIILPTQNDKNCHFPKPILLMTGKISFPYEWQPAVVSLQMFQIGQFSLAAVPGEFTTMSGRRLRQAIEKATISNGGPENVKVVLAGLSNVYSSYIATPEEYQLQRYEGASTIYGPYTLSIYLKLYTKLVAAMMQGKPLASDTPYKFPKTLLSLVLPVFFDWSGILSSFGDCIHEPKKKYTIGDTVSVTFVSGHLRNNNLQEKTFLTVQKKDNDTWVTISTDASWETKLLWSKTSIVTSKVEIQWYITSDTKPGTYRIEHYGYYKSLVGTKPYQGRSKSFVVT